MSLLVSASRIIESIKTLNGYCEKFKRDCATIEKSVLRRLVFSDDAKVINQTAQTFARLCKLSPEEVRTILVAENGADVKETMQNYIDIDITPYITNTYPQFECL